MIKLTEITMSSNIKIQKTCQFCGKKFIARKTVTQYCSHTCSQRGYKERKRNERIERARHRSRICTDAADGASQ